MGKPTIRFKGYTDDWELRKVTELLKNSSSAMKIGPFGSALKKEYFVEEGIKVYAQENAFTGDFSMGDYYITEDKYKELKSCELYPGDLVISMMGTIGACAIFPKNAEKGIMNSHLLRLQFNNEVIPEYIMYLLRDSVLIRKQIDRLSVGSIMSGLSSSVVKKLVFPISKLAEQKRIVEYLDSIDHLITLHQCKCDQAKILKKYMLQKMFPQNDEKVPKIRFKSFTDDWEQRKLGDIYGSIGNAFVGTATPYYAEQGHFYLESNNVKDGQINHNSEIFINDEFYEKQKDKWLHTGDMVMVQSGHVGHAAVIPEELDNTAAHALIMFRNPKEEIEPYFLNYEYQTDKTKRKIENITTGNTIKHILASDMQEFIVDVPKYEEQKEIAGYFCSLDYLITLHQCKYNGDQRIDLFAWEQRKLGELGTVQTCKRIFKEQTSEQGDIPFFKNGTIGLEPDSYISREVYEEFRRLYPYPEVGDTLISVVGSIGRTAEYAGKDEYFQDSNVVWLKTDGSINKKFLKISYQVIKWLIEGSTVKHLYNNNILRSEIVMPVSQIEQAKIAEFFEALDHLITLHQHKYIYIKNAIKHTGFTLLTTKEEQKMPELEKIIEEKLINQLVYGESQWTYRKDLKTEEDLWKNFKYILEQNNKDRLNGENLSDTEFEQVKNQLQFSSFYKAGEWLVGENGKVQVHVQRGTERLHLVVMNHEHIAGGSSVYEVINQYSALKTEEDNTASARDRRFDVTLMINGLPMIHIELKNKQYSYMDGFWQIKKYISEGKFTGIFSAVQMFVVSNGVDTRYFAAASDTELNPKFMSGWVDKENNPVSDYIDFAKSVLRIPEAHEMIARYTVLDEDAKRLILLRPYQIHAIESIREASRTGRSGYVWHTTGSGKTLTSYKATRNLLMDIPAIDKAIFLIDRKDLDTQTTMAFQAYANNDLVDVDETDNVNDLKKKLKSDDRQVIVTTIQKLQILISKRLQEGTTEYTKIKNLKIAFVVDECHRAVTPKTKRELERFFGRSLWYGFTGTPRFAENPYPQMGDLPRTTEELYGERLHKYTIQNVIHDNAVLGFQVEHNGPKNIEDETVANAYNNETHMLKVLDIILNKSYHKLGFQNGKGQTYEGLLTTSSITLAQTYYELLTKVKNRETSLKIDEKIKRVLPDFPKFAITYSVTENEEGSHVNQQKMQQSLNDYNSMFGTKYDLSQIQAYNGNLNKRLARKDPKFKSRSEQLDLVIVVDRLLTGFDAPCMSTIFIDRQPMGPHDLIQAFSRTNRIYDKNKTYGQIVTFQAPKLFKESVDNAVRLYSAGSTEVAFLAEWEEVEPAFKKALAALRASAETPSEVTNMSLKEKKVFVKMFQTFDRLFAQLKSFTRYEDGMLEEYGISESEYEDYAGHYQNAMEEIKIEEGNGDDPSPEEDDTGVDPDYELMAYSTTKIDYEYIINLIQNIVTPQEDSEAVTPEERKKQIDEVKQYVEEMKKDNPKVAEIMSNLICEIELDENKYKGQSIFHIVENMKHDCIDKVISEFCENWYASKEDVMYAALHYRNGEIPNESVIKATIDYSTYKNTQEKALPKFKYYARCIAELKKTLEEEIKPLLDVA